MQNPLTKFPIHAGTLSFLLPGLGQLYQKRLPPAVLFFAAYIGVLSLSSYRVWIFVPMALSAWDAQRQLKQTYAVWNARTLSYFAVGTVGFFSAFSLMVEKVLPYPQMGKMSYVADALANEIRRCTVEARALPPAIERCPGLAERWKMDPWGRPFRFVPLPPGVEIRSAGRDGLDKTDDDFIYRFQSPLR